MLLSLVNIVTIHSLTNQRWSLECFHWPSHRLSLHTYVPYVQTLPTLGVIETGGWFDDPCLAPNWDIITDIKLSYLVFCCWQKMQKKSNSILIPFYTHTHTQQFGMDCEALKEMCPDCPEELFDLTNRCCQVQYTHRSHTHTHTSTMHTFWWLHLAANVNIACMLH